MGRSQDQCATITIITLRGNQFHSFTHRWTFADETVWCVACNSTCSTISAGSPFTAIKHLITALAWRTETKHSSQSVHRFALLCAVVCCHVPIPTCVTSAAFTSVAVGELNAVVGPSGVTGVRQTLVDISLTTFTYVAGQAHTLVTSDAVHTFAIVEALGLICQWVSEGGAIIQINLTVDTFKRA